MNDPSAPDPGEDREPGDTDGGDPVEPGDDDPLETDEGEPIEGTGTPSVVQDGAIQTNGRDPPMDAPRDPPAGAEGDGQGDRIGDGSSGDHPDERREEVREMQVATDDGPTADTSREVRHANPDPRPGDHTTGDERDPGPAERDPKPGVDGRDPDDAGPRGPDARGTTDWTGPDALKWLSGIVALVGSWIAASAFVYGAGAAALWNNVAVGMAILLLAGYNFYRTTGGLAPNVGGSSLVALLGVWSVIAPMLLPFASEPLAWSTMASGAAIAVLSGYNAYETRRTATTAAPGTRA